MRQFYLHIRIALSLGVLALASCEKDTPATQIVTPTPTVAVPNTPPKVVAGPDQRITVPNDTVILAGQATDAQGNIEKYLWKQVSGPLPANIASPGSARTKVAGLKKGTYDFELAVTDKGGLTGRDTVSVIVQEPAVPGHGEVIFDDLTWLCPMGCTLLINCFSCYVPSNQPYKVFLRAEHSNQWIEAVPATQWTDTTKYAYGIQENNLWIYTNDDGGRTDVKLSY